MRGLKTQENEQFNQFWELIQNAAAQSGYVFFGFAGEGRDFATDTMEGEDFSGWLVPVEHADEFEQLWSNNDADLFQSDPFDSHFTFVAWYKVGESVSVEFKDFQNE